MLNPPLSCQAKLASSGLQPVTPAEKVGHTEGHACKSRGFVTMRTEEALALGQHGLLALLHQRLLPQRLLS